jgi:arginyl-tRNA--protein-N-Asp/Glu arginylyltransferase
MKSMIHYWDINEFSWFLCQNQIIKRKRIGYYVLGFFFTSCFSINLKKEFWKDIK